MSLYPSIFSTAPTAIPLSTGASVSSNEYDPSTMTASNPTFGAAVAAAEVTRLQNLASIAMNRRATAYSPITTWQSSYAALQTETALGGSSTVAAMRTKLDAFLRADDALPAAVRGAGL